MKIETGHSSSAPSPSRLSTLNEKLEMVLATLPKLTNEEHKQCCEMAKIMLKVAVPPDTILNTVNAKDQIYGGVSTSFAVRWKDILGRLWNFIDKDGNFHTIVYNHDLDKPTIVAGWTSVFFLTIFKSSSLPKSFPRCHSLYHQVPNFITFKVYLTPHKVTCSSLDVPDTMYYFLKDKGWTHLHLEDVAECRLGFNHWRKTVKIGAGWKYFCETLSLKVGMEIIFEFLDPTVNHVLFWPY
ncbi:hypothetical protein GmHk_19G054994 [Glycine max]|nr:hypothetical protein GmHk_19G054994 [Glycine max]